VYSHCQRRLAGVNSVQAEQAPLRQGDDRQCRQCEGGNAYSQTSGIFRVSGAKNRLMIKSSKLLKTNGEKGLRNA